MKLNDIRDEIESNPNISHQIQLETLYNKNQLISRIKHEFKSEKTFNIIKYMENKNIDADFGLDLLVQMVLHKRTTLPTMVGILRHHFTTHNGGHDASQKTADLIVKCAEADLVDWSPVSQQLIVCHDISKDVQDELDKYQFPLPMVVSPRKVASNTDTPYVITKDGSLILRNNHHSDDICLDHINRVNQIRFSLDNDTAQMIQNKWRNLDKPKLGETKQDFEKRKRAFNKYDKSARHVMALVTKLGNEFYLTHKYDKRGRVYCQGYHVNYQGAPWNKAVIQLADKEIIP